MEKILNSNVCDEQILNLSGYELELCESILDNAFTKGLILGLSK